MSRHKWSEPVKGRDKWIETCCCGTRRITEKMNAALKRSYIYYEYNGQQTRTAPVCSGPVNQTMLAL